MGSLESLAYFFESAAICLPENESSEMLHYKMENERTLPLFINNSIVGIKFKLNGESLDRVVRKGLSFVASRRYTGFGINEFDIHSIDNSSIEQVPRSCAPARFKRRNNFASAVYVPSSAPILLERKVEEASQLVDHWRSTKQIPHQFLDMLFDSREKKERLLLMIGTQTYRIRRNLGLGSKIRERAYGFTNHLKRIKERLHESWLSNPITARELEKVIFNYNILIDGLHPGVQIFRDDTIVDNAIKKIAKAAFDIRSGYPKRGWEVTTGLVKREDYTKLSTSAVELGADSILVEKILKSNHPSKNVRYNRRRDFRRNFYEYSVCTGSFDVSYDGDRRRELARDISAGILEKRQETILTIGNMRAKQIVDGKIPYKKEFRVIHGMLATYLTRKYFENEVNRWLNIRGREAVKWDEIGYLLEN